MVLEDQEVALVKEAIAQGDVLFGDRVSVRQALRVLLDLRVAQPVSESTITQLLDRVAPKVVPGASASDLQTVAFALSRQWHFEKGVAYLLSRKEV